MINPGSFPELAEFTVATFSLKVDRPRLETLAEEYRHEDAPLVANLTEDLIAVRCPETRLDDIAEFGKRLAGECRVFGIPGGGP
jgi:hypothetical protein